MNLFSKIVKNLSRFPFTQITPSYRYMIGPKYAFVYSVIVQFCAYFPVKTNFTNKLSDAITSLAN